MSCRTLEYYLKEWRDNVEKTIHIQYDSPASVRKNNRAVDRYRKIATLKGEQYPDNIEYFAEFLNDENETIRVTAAVCLISLMPHTLAQLSQSKIIIDEHISFYLSVPETDIGWKWFLSQPWTQESRCTDYPAENENETDGLKVVGIY